MSSNRAPTSHRHFSDSRMSSCTNAPSSSRLSACGPISRSYRLVRAFPPYVSRWRVPARWVSTASRWYDSEANSDRRKSPPGRGMVQYTPVPSKTVASPRTSREPPVHWALTYHESEPSSHDAGPPGTNWVDWNVANPPETERYESFSMS